MKVLIAIRNFLNKLICRLLHKQPIMSDSQVKALAKTKKKGKKTINLYVVFQNISDDMEVYNNPTTVPLYIATTEEEALAACFRLIYIKHIDHYFAWCSQHHVPAGIDENSWWEYVDTLHGGMNNLINQSFKIIAAKQSLSALVSIYRATIGTVTILGLPSETPIETAIFMDKAEIQSKPTNPTEKYLVPINSSESVVKNHSYIAPIKDFLGCDTIGDFLGKLALLCPLDFIGFKENSGLRAQWTDLITNQPELKESLTQEDLFESQPPITPNYSPLVYARALETANSISADFEQELKTNTAVIEAIQKIIEEKEKEQKAKKEKVKEAEENKEECCGECDCEYCKKQAEEKEEKAETEKVEEVKEEKVEEGEKEEVKEEIQEEKEN